MEFNFDKTTNEFLKTLILCAREQNIEIFFVGGIVRDNVLNIQNDEIKDIDLIVAHDAIKFAKTLEKKSSQIKIKSIHKDFSTVKIKYKNKCYDLASTRSETYPYSGCLPKVTDIGVDIKKDSTRRDFTINSLYCKLDIKNNKITYKLIDLDNIKGQKDIKSKTLRVLHDKSYIDDPTRIIRGLGFKYRFGFDFSEHDKELIEQYYNIINDDMRQNQSKDRILSVFKKVFDNEKQDKIFNEIIKKKYYKILYNDELNVDFKKINNIIKMFDLDDDNCPKSEQKAEFYYNIIKNEEIEKHDFGLLIEIEKFFSKLKKSQIAYYYYKTEDKSALDYSKLKKIELFISAKTLLEEGYAQGKIIGEILNDLLKEKFNNPKTLSTKEKELCWVRKNYPVI